MVVKGSTWWWNYFDVCGTICSYRLQGEHCGDVSPEDLKDTYGIDMYACVCVFGLLTYGVPPIDDSWNLKGT